MWNKNIYFLRGNFILYKFIDALKKLSQMFYVKWTALFIIAACFGFGIIGPFIHHIDKATVETSAAKKNFLFIVLEQMKKKLLLVSMPLGERLG